MSRIGKYPIRIPKGVTLTVDGDMVKVKGPKGILEFKVPSQISVQGQDGLAVVQRVSGGREAKALHGTARAQIHNMVVGVTGGYRKALEIHGVGYRVQQQGRSLSFSLGYSHPVVFELPEGIDANVEKPTAFTVLGTSKYLVGQTAAAIRALKPPDPYKAKGIRYAGEVIKTKAGKAGKGAK